MTHAYGSAQPALVDVHLTLTPGVTALIGVNGAGKSTLLSILAGALKPSRGAVRLNGQDLYGRGRQRALRDVSLMPQHVEWPKGLTAVEMVSLLAWSRGMPSATARPAATRALEKVGLSDRATSRVSQLSGGMQRRLALAQALVNEPSVVLLDEPSTGLDPEQRRAMVDLIRDVDGTVLFSSHVMEDILDVADRVIVLASGAVAFDGPLTALVALAPPATPPHRQAEMAFFEVTRGCGVPR